MQLLEDELFANKDKVNRHLAIVKYKDLKFLKKHSGLFVSAEDIETYMEQSDLEDRNQPLYVKVRYDKNTS